MTVIDLRGWRYDHMVMLFFGVGALLVGVSLWILVFIMLRSFYTDLCDFMCSLLKYIKKVERF